MVHGDRPICFECKHLFDETVEEKAGREGFRCKAFPDTMIPDDIIDGNFVHTTKHPEQAEDNDFVFEPMEED